MEKKIFHENRSDDTEISYYTMLQDFKIIVLLSQITTLNSYFDVSREKDHELLIIDVKYHNQVTDKFFNWNILRRFENIYSFFNTVKIYTIKNKLIIDNRDIGNKLELIFNLEVNEYKSRLDLIIEVLNRLARLKIKIALEFLELSRYSFNCFNEDIKPKEGYIMKRSDNSRPGCIKAIISCPGISYFFLKWNVRWFVLKDDMICYMNSSSSNIAKDVIYVKKRYFGLIKS
jgi:hypothetical protein